MVLMVLFSPLLLSSISFASSSSTSGRIRLIDVTIGGLRTLFSSASSALVAALVAALLATLHATLHSLFRRRWGGPLLFAMRRRCSIAQHVLDPLLCEAVATASRHSMMSSPVPVLGAAGMVCLASNGFDDVEEAACRAWSPTSPSLLHPATATCYMEGGLADVHKH